MKSSQILAIVIFFLGLVWIGSGFWGVREKSQSAPQTTTAESVQSDKTIAEPELPQVRVRVSKAERFPDVVTVTGRSKASQSVSLRAETAGQLETLIQEEGALVKAGEVVARLELRDRQAKLDEARQRLAQRQIEYDAARQLEDRGFNSRVRLSEAQADLEDARAVLKIAEIDLEKTQIKAPFDGVIATQLVDEGDYLSLGDTIFTIVDLDPIEFVGFVSEQNISKLTPGLKGFAEMLDGIKIPAVISFISPAADPQTRTFRIIMQAENPEMKLREGLTVRLLIPVEDKAAHLISPSILSLNDDGVLGVKVVDQTNVVKFVPVQILSDTLNGMYIHGPEENARIISVGQDYVLDGQKVKPVEVSGDGLL